MLHTPLISSSALALSQPPTEGFRGLLPDSWVPGAMLAAGVALVCLVMLRQWSKRRRAMRSRDEREESMTAKERMERARVRAASSDPPASALERLMVEAQELTRECSAQLDTKAARLERLIEEANATLVRLEAATRGDEAQPSMRPASGPVTDRALSGVGFPLDTGVRTRPEAIERSLEPKPTGLSDDPVADRVMHLARRGLTPVQIAQELGEQVGRVELMLALRRA